MNRKIFVTGGSGFIGSAFVRYAADAGHKVHVLTRSEKSAERVRSQSAEAVIGDLNKPGPWQDTAAKAQVVLHLAQPETYGARVTKKHAENFREQRLRMDANLLECLSADNVYRVIYVGGTSYYGHQGDAWVDEDSTPRPKGWGPYIAPAIEALATYTARGLPIIQAFPAWVYGPGSWLAEYQLEPLFAKKALVNLRRPDPVISVVHVEDVGHALAHLIDHGEIGKRYFISDDQPLTAAQLAALTAQEMGMPLRIWRLPVLMSRLAVGPIITDSLNTEARLSNARLKATGFEFKFPTAAQGIPNVVSHWLEQKKRQSQ